MKEKNDLQCQKDKELVELEKKWSQEYNKIKNEKDELFMSEFSDLFGYYRITKINCFSVIMILASLDRGKRLQAREDSITRLQTEIGELNSRLRAIDSEWRDAKNKLSKDSTFKRLSQENEKLKGWSIFGPRDLDPVFRPFLGQIF